MPALRPRRRESSWPRREQHGLRADEVDGELQNFAISLLGRVGRSRIIHGRRGNSPSAPLHEPVPGALTSGKLLGGAIALPLLIK